MENDRQPLADDHLTADSDEVKIPELCKACTARHSGICGALTPQELRDFNRVSSRKKFEAGKILIADEEEFPFFGSVLAGVVKLSKTLTDGRQQIVGLQFAPDFLGRPFQKESRLSIEAASDVELCAMSRGVFERMMENYGGLQNRLLKQTLIELDESREWLVTLGRKTARERVASFLYMIAQHVPRQAEGEEDAVSFDLPLSRTDMADFLGLTIETVSRQLTKLRKDGVIAITQNRHILVPDMEKLRRTGEDQT